MSRKFSTSQFLNLTCGRLAACQHTAKRKIRQAVAFLWHFRKYSLSQSRKSTSNVRASCTSASQHWSVESAHVRRIFWVIAKVLPGQLAWSVERSFIVCPIKKTDQKRNNGAHTSCLLGSTPWRHLPASWADRCSGESTSCSCLSRAKRFSVVLTFFFN